jgi:hypothetical protein
MICQDQRHQNEVHKNIRLGAAKFMRLSSSRREFRRLNR